MGKQSFLQFNAVIAYCILHIACCIVYFVNSFANCDTVFFISFLYLLMPILEKYTIEIDSTRFNFLGNC